VDAGWPISPTIAGAIASFGRTEVAVRHRVRVGVIVTGDEVVGAGDAPTPFQIRDSHASALRAMLGGVPWIDLVAVGRVHDDPEALMQTAFTLLPRVDALFLTAGVSVGPRDLVPGVLVSLDVETLFRGVAQRPGRPTLGAIGPQGQLVMGLPGNPLSVFVAARRIAAPALAHMAGLGADALAPTLVRIDQGDDKTIDVYWHRPVRLGADGTAALARITSSGDFAGAAPTDGFVQVPPRTHAAGLFPYYPWAII
jgi:molybdopterin molybdotransferase